MKRLQYSQQGLRASVADEEAMGHAWRVKIFTQAGRHLVVRTRVADRPGQLGRLLTRLGAEGVNVLEVEHEREGMDIPMGDTGIGLTLLTRGEAHCEELLELMRSAGYPVERVR